MSSMDLMSYVSLMIIKRREKFFSSLDSFRIDKDRSNISSDISIAKAKNLVLAGEQTKISTTPSINPMNALCMSPRMASPCLHTSLSISDESSTDGRTPNASYVGGRGMKTSFALSNHMRSDTQLIGPRVLISQGPDKGYVTIVTDATESTY